MRPKEADSGSRRIPGIPDIPAMNLVDQQSEMMHRGAFMVHALHHELLLVAGQYIEISDADRLNLPAFLKKLGSLDRRAKWLPEADKNEAGERIDPYTQILTGLPKDVITFYQDQSKKHREELDQAMKASRQYLELEARLELLQGENNDILARLFSGQNSSALLRDRLDKNKAQITKIKKEMIKAKEGNREVACFLEYRRTQQYASVLMEGGYVVTDSRIPFIEHIREVMLTTRKTPMILLTGSSGSGKTSIANYAACLLTGKDAIGQVTSYDMDITKLFGSRQARDNMAGFYVVYGSMGRLITGRISSDSETLVDSKEARIGFLDEITLLPPERQTELVKTIASLRPGRELLLERLPGARLILAGEIGIIMASNVKSESKHPDRYDIPPETQREFNTAIKIPYLTQTPENPEIYDLFKAALMDSYGMMTVSGEDLEIPWRKAPSSATAQVEWVVDTDPKRGGVIWRLANFLVQAQAAYEEDENVLTKSLGSDAILRKAVPDIDKFIQMLLAYQITIGNSQNLVNYICNFLDHWIGQEQDTARQESLPAEDRKFLSQLRRTYGLDATTLSQPPRPFRILSPMEIGALSPRIKPKESTKLNLPQTATVYDRDGTPYEVKPGPVGSIPEGEIMKVKRDKDTDLFTVKGTTLKDGQLLAVLYNEESQEVILVDPNNLERDYAYYMMNIEPGGGFGEPPAVRLCGDIEPEEGEDDYKGRGYLYRDLHSDKSVSIRPAIVVVARKRIPPDRSKLDDLMNEIEYLGQSN